MTREEAIEKLYMEWQKFLEDNIDYAGISEAYKMAFKALSQEPCDDAEQIDYHDDFATALKKINDYEMTRDERAAISILNAYKVGYESAIEDYKQEKSGKWIDYRDDGFVECPFCGHATNCEDDIDELHYCFYCGARMVEPQEKQCAECNHYGKLSLDCSRCDDDCSMFEPQESEEQTE